MIFLRGLFFPIASLPIFLKPLSYAHPLTYGAGADGDRPPVVVQAQTAPSRGNRRVPGGQPNDRENPRNWAARKTA
jgi:hypothetical protein